MPGLWTSCNVSTYLVWWEAADDVLNDDGDLGVEDEAAGDDEVGGHGRQQLTHTGDPVSDLYTQRIQ